MSQCNKLLIVSCAQFLQLWLWCELSILANVWNDAHEFGSQHVHCLLKFVHVLRYVKAQYHTTILNNMANNIILLEHVHLNLQVCEECVQKSSQAWIIHLRALHICMCVYVCACVYITFVYMYTCVMYTTHMFAYTHHTYTCTQTSMLTIASFSKRLHHQLFVNNLLQIMSFLSCNIKHLAHIYKQ